MKKFIYLLGLFGALFAGATGAVSAAQSDVIDYLTDAHTTYTGASVADNVAKMDTDHNGFADVAEVRAYLMLKHGADYQKATLDRWELAAKGKSCGTSLLKSLSTD